MLNGTDEKRVALSESMSKTLEGVIDVGDPAHRTAGALYVILKSQLDLLGFQPGSVPLSARLGSEQCRGALMGTAAAVVRGHRASPEPDHFVDAISAAFTIVYGAQAGPPSARETIAQSAARNQAVNAASDIAVQDTNETWSDDTPSAPMAFYRAARAAL